MICSNGLVDIINEPIVRNPNNNENIDMKIKMMTPIAAKQLGTNPSTLINNVEPSIVSRAFFSDKNIETIHSTIIKCVCDKTGIVIDRQNPQRLLAIMRNIFMENRVDDFTGRFMKNQNVTDREYLNHLNARTIQHTVNILKNEVIAYNRFREDISTLAVPHDLPILSNMRNKTLEFKSWF